MPSTPQSLHAPRPEFCGASRHAFTLLEILVTLTLMVLLMGLTLPRLSGTMDSSRVKGTARKIVGMLRLARNYAVVSGQMTSVEFDLENDKLQFHVLNDLGEHMELKREYFEESSKNAEIHLPPLGNELAYPQKLAQHVYISAVYSSAPPSVKEKLGQEIFYPDGSAESCTLAIEDMKGQNTISVEVYRSTGLAKTEKGMAPQLQPEPGKVLYYGPSKKPKTE